MCRFACKDPATCKISRFTVSQVKGGGGPSEQFVRNQRIKFFSPASDSESDDEFQSGAAAPFGNWQQRAGKPVATAMPSSPDESSTATTRCPSSPSSTSSSDSDCFVEEARANGKKQQQNGEEEEESDSGVSSGEQSTTATEATTALKPILMVGPKKEAAEGEGEKKRVRFADDCGHSLVHCRSIQSRRIDALFADIVEIGPTNDEETSPWRMALLRKLYAASANADGMMSRKGAEAFGTRRA